jgi:hypothetical protein
VAKSNLKKEDDYELCVTLVPVLKYSKDLGSKPLRDYTDNEMEDLEVAVKNLNREIFLAKRHRREVQIEKILDGIKAQLTPNLRKRLVELYTLPGYSARHVFAYNKRKKVVYFLVNNPTQTLHREAYRAAASEAQSLGCETKAGYTLIFYCRVASYTGPKTVVYQLRADGSVADEEGQTF